MTIWALADLHLALSCPEKDMGVFGPAWEGYMDAIARNWRETVANDDLVLLPGDITWAMRADDAAKDLQWIDALPGTKVMIRGNHDYWWQSLSKVRTLCPPSIHPLQHTPFEWEETSISGTRLWDNEEFSFSEDQEEQDLAQQRKIFKRELIRLELACKALNQTAKRRIIMTHYPPIGGDLADSRVSKLLEEYRVDVCTFGHLHNVIEPEKLFGEKNGIRYLLVSADAVNFTPQKVFS